jgi:hypothetical protein
MKFVAGDAGAKSVRIRKHAEIVLPDGGMINGIITDEEVMTRFFAQVRSDYGLGKEATMLVINNNNIQAKSLEIPPVPEDMAIEFIRREYSQYSENDNSVYDYAVLSPKGAGGGVRILAVGAPRDLIASYRRVLVSAGFDLKRIDIGLNCQIKLARFLPQLQQGSVILALIDGRMLTLTLFENGNYVISNRYRLPRTDDASALTEEIGGNISSMIQFNKTQKDSAAITVAYIAGTDETGIDALRFSMNHLGIDIRPLDMSANVSPAEKSPADAEAAFDTGRYLLNIGNLLKK